MVQSGTKLRFFMCHNYRYTELIVDRSDDSMGLILEQNKRTLGAPNGATNLNNNKDSSNNLRLQHMACTDAFSSSGNNKTI